MRTLTLILLGLVALSPLAVSAQTAPTKPAASATALPPIIDRDLFFGDPEISGAQLSPDGKFMSFIKPYKGTRNIWVKALNAPFPAAKPMTADTTRPIRGYFWSRDGKYLLFSQDKGGDENFNIYAVNPVETLKAGQDVPTARDLTGLKGVRVYIYNVPKTDPNSIYIGLNERDKAWHDLYKLNLTTGEKTLVRKNTDRIGGWDFDWDDKLRFASRSNEDGSTDILRVDADGLKKIYSAKLGENAGIAGFTKDNKRVYLISNTGNERDLTEVLLMDPESGKSETYEVDPMKRVDLSNMAFSEKTREPIYTIYEDDRVRYLWKDKSFQTDYAMIKKQLPNVDAYFGSHTNDERYWLVSATSDIDPGATYLYDRQTKTLTFQYRPRPKLPVTDLAPMQTLRYKSSDGLEIPAYLTLPKGVAAKNLPLVVFPHGGPWARDTWGYDSFSQFLANRGYAVLQPNFRASTGYGKKFLNAGNRQWGLLMQDDITWGVKELIAKGIVDPKRVGIMGISYGGYATLAGLAYTPDVYAAGVSYVGPSNLLTLLNSIPAYWEAGRKQMYEWMGDPNTPEGKAILTKASPLNSSDKIKAPLLVIQGANDPRVNKAESDQIVIALRDRGFPVEYIVAPDEGHGFARPVNSQAALAAAEKFLAKHLGGRYQESMPDNIAKRLTEITVDPKTVTLAKKVAVSNEAPKPSGNLKAGVYSYKVNLEAQGQNIPMDRTITVAEAGDNLKISDKVSSAMTGEITDEVEVTKATLAPVKRAIKQGPVTIETTYTAEKVTGTMGMNGQNKPIDSKLEGALFADGGGDGLQLATLPLKEGYSTTYRNFDLTQQKTKAYALTVVGKESVTVPAGTFDAWKVEIKPADGSAGSRTLYMATDGSGRFIKEEAVIQGGMKMVSELAK
ncbi:S9 family peptidase [Spirosoma montaniterrae]|uniref:S9 family peptidase n=1 Tax=Spirosoma montaniterrae TaxID=1178516 RepID=UPI0009FAA8A5|nr:S9 family peptidase [Spirosoma montaniterrae]